MYFSRVFFAYIPPTYILYWIWRILNDRLYIALHHPPGSRGHGLGDWMLVSNDFCQLGWYMEVCPNCISTIACFHVSLEQCFRGGRGITMATISHHQQHFPSHQSTYINLDIPIPTTIISPTTLQQEMEEMWRQCWRCLRGIWMLINYFS
jgi:hypothetical protein